MGRDKLDYYPDAGSRASNLTETKIFVNSIILDTHKGVRFISIEFMIFLATRILKPEYMKVSLKHFSPYIQEKLQELPHSDGSVYMCINKGAYVLK